MVWSVPAMAYLRAARDFQKGLPRKNSRHDRDPEPMRGGETGPPVLGIVPESRRSSDMTVRHDSAATAGQHATRMASAMRAVS